MMIKSMLPQCGSTFCLGHSCSGAARGNWATGLTCRLCPLPLPHSLSLSLSHSRARLDVCRHEASAACQRVWMLQMSYSLPLSLSPPSLLSLSLSLSPLAVGSFRFRALSQCSARASAAGCRFNLRLCNLPQQQDGAP